MDTTQWDVNQTEVFSSEGEGMTPKHKESFNLQRLEILKIIQVTVFNSSPTTIKEELEKVQWELYYRKEIEWLEEKIWPKIK